MRISIILSFLAILAGCGNTPEPGIPGRYVTESNSGNLFSIAASGHVAPILVSASDHPGVIRALRDLQSDLERVTGTAPEMMVDSTGGWQESFDGAEIIIAGAIGKSPLIDRLIEDKKLDIAAIAGKWESSLTRVINDPYPGISRALVIAGSDKRGTIYGIYEMSAQIGVSPWYYWADVAPRHADELYALPGAYVLGEPAVKYRGIFINDEAPALSGWVQENFGAFNHQFYAHVFELILRMKGNYLWPAMWGRAFYDDDPINAPLADEYGIVIGTTHHEPLMRAHVEWARYGTGPWDYRKNKERLEAFWAEGIQRMGTHESIVSLGMRGDGDEPMTEGTAISLLEEIVEDQRTIIREVTGKEPSETPQLWALYKEVQDYYDKGMRVPDDVTLLLCDDNWGNIRKLPKSGDPGRTGGYGIYYHFDYVGGPRNYKWLNTSQIERVWEQMNLALEYGVDQIWIVNVGDIKPMELPTQFFLDFAWDPGKWNSSNIDTYYRQWAGQQFGESLAMEVAEILATYTKFNARRKPELLSPETYSLIHFREAERVVQEYNALSSSAEKLYGEIPAGLKDAYYQLVLFPVKACANLNELYVAAARNRLYAQQGRIATNRMAARVRQLFRTDSLLTLQYHNELAEGKWNHMMSQTHIGYTYWQQPEQNNMPAVVELTFPDESIMGVALEGSAQVWPGSEEVPVLPPFDRLNRQDYYVELFNRGNTPFECSITPGEPWIIPGKKEVLVRDEERIHMTVDWDRVPEGTHRIPIEIGGPDVNRVTIFVVVDNRPLPIGDIARGTFVDNNGMVSLEASHFSKSVVQGEIRWEVVPNLGRTGSAVMATPVTAGSSTPGEGAPHLEYTVLLRDTGTVTIHSYLSPTLNFHNTEGLKFALSLDDETPRVINMHDQDHPYLWNNWVSNNIIDGSSVHTIRAPGVHTLKWWRVDAGVVLQRIVVTSGELPVPGYLGPPESMRFNP